MRSDVPTSGETLRAAGTGALQAGGTGGRRNRFAAGRQYLLRHWRLAAAACCWRPAIRAGLSSSRHEACPPLGDGAILCRRAKVRRRPALPIRVRVYPSPSESGKVRRRPRRRRHARGRCPGDGIERAGDGRPARPGDWIEQGCRPIWVRTVRRGSGRPVAGRPSRGGGRWLLWPGGGRGRGVPGGPPPSQPMLVAAVTAVTRRTRAGSAVSAEVQGRAANRGPCHGVTFA